MHIANKIRTFAQDLVKTQSMSHMSDTMMMHRNYFVGHHWIYEGMTRKQSKLYWQAYFHHPSSLRNSRQARKQLSIFQFVRKCSFVEEQQQ